MKKLRISIIAAIAENRAIGKNNKLLWHIPEDLKRFKQLTMGHAVIMGQKTFESLGKPLPSRVNIVLTKNHNLQADGCCIARSLKQALTLARQRELNEIFFIGGGQVYRQALPLVDRLYLTVVSGEYEADTYFPDYSEFKTIISEESHDNGKHQFIFLILER